MFSRCLSRLNASVLALFLPAAALALEIPLKKGSGEATRVGFVDMERIFREYPETQKARAEYFQEVERQRAALAERERQLASLTDQMAALQSAVAQPPAAEAVSSTGAAPSLSTGAAPTPAISTATAAAVEEGLAKRSSELEKRKAELTLARQTSAQALRDLEARRSKQILGSLYKALTQLADEKGVGLVVDKSAILYGQEAVDLTEALSRRVRGLPEEEPK